MSTVQKFRVRSPAIEAMRWDGDLLDAAAWLGYAYRGVRKIDGQAILRIENRSGIVNANLGDWIVHDDDGFYPMNDLQFQAIYEAKP